MQAETLLSFPARITLADAFLTGGTWHLVLTSTSPAANCPVCQRPSEAQHSRYQRTVRDVPCGGYPVRIVLQTRRFFCRQPDCDRRIFTERFPAFLLPRARLTERFRVWR
jgi:transposase